MSACEAVWRTFAFDIHDKWPPVQRLTLHLDGKQQVFYKDRQKLKRIVEKNKEKNTMFEAWMQANAEYPEARSLTYAEFPAKFVFDRNAAK